MLAGCVGYSDSWSKTQLFIGTLQMMTAVYLIGWVWSIWWGWKMLFFSDSQNREKMRREQMFLNRTAVRSDEIDFNNAG